MHHGSSSSGTGLAKCKAGEYRQLKRNVIDGLLSALNLTQLSTLDRQSARSTVRDIFSEVLLSFGGEVSVQQQEVLFNDVCDDVMGYGPLEPLLARDNVTDIMVNGPDCVFIEIKGITEKTDIRFDDNQHLMSICQRIVSAVGRRVDEASPICDARLPDGSRVNVIVPPLSIEGPVLTIRKFRRQRLTLDDLVEIGTLPAAVKTLLEIAARCRCNMIVSGGTGSGKTTLLNCLSACADVTERLITCEDAAELQLQHPHVIRLETRPRNLEGQGEITMRELVRNCLRMRPDRIIVGEVRGAEAFDLLQAMNTGHDGSMGTIHANTPTDAITRLEAMVLVGGFGLPSQLVRQSIASSIDLIIQVSRMRDGSRRVTQVSEVAGIEIDRIQLRDIFAFNPSDDQILSTVAGLRESSRVWQKALRFGEVRRLAAALNECAAQSSTFARDNV